MQLINPCVEHKIQKYSDMVSEIEEYGRTAYKSECSGIIEQSYKFIQMIIKRGHESVLEHKCLTVRIVCDRGVSHEIVRHRIGSYTQESTRYCNYSKKGIQFIVPVFYYNIKIVVWLIAMFFSSLFYNILMKLGSTPQEARSVLPNSLKTEIVVTYNIREWRHFLKLRCDKSAHPQMREVANMILELFLKEYPIFFEDLKKLENL